MDRKNFIEKSVLGAGGLGLGGLTNESWVGSQIQASTNDKTRNTGGYQELERYKIADIQFTDMELHYPRQVGINARLGIQGMGPAVHVGILKKDKGAAGWGMTRGGGKHL